MALATLMPPTIAFLTDFGLRDHYVGAMKGAALSVCPEATLVDISHDIPPQDIQAAAFELAAAYKYFPAGTVFVAVVDPGVGSTRRGIAAIAGDYRFVAPDNGVLTLVFRDRRPSLVVELTETKYARPTMSKTFEGRDRFAPAAAWLAKGRNISSLGSGVQDWIEIALRAPQVSDESLAGEVVHADHFGNLITNIDRATLERFGGGAPVTLAIGAHARVPIVGTYADVPTGQLCALLGSSDRLEIAMNGGSAAGHLGPAPWAAIIVTRR